MGSPMARQQFRLFRVFGITVFLHWSWFLVAAYELDQRAGRYSSLGWNIAEYLALFAIVLLHEFGHSLACRQVGGSAEEIILWPLGGVAFVSPPPRAGAVLWSIAAGPLVNVALLALLTVAGPFLHGLALSASAAHFVRQLWWINFMLLAFNLLPIYPLDGGQILRALLWFALGRARSLFVAAALGVAGTVGLAAFTVAKGYFSFWTGIMAVFLLSRCWQGFREAKDLAVLARMPRRAGFACPSCRAQPLRARAWICPECRQSFDTFAHGAVCPGCGGVAPVTGCPECRRAHPFAEWVCG